MAMYPIRKNRIESIAGKRGFFIDFVVFSFAEEDTLIVFLLLLLPAAAVMMVVLEEEEEEEERLL